VSRGARLRLAAASAILLACAAALLLPLPDAAAHANLATSTPAQGMHLDAPPARATITFTEPIDPSGTHIAVLNATGDRVDLGDVAFGSGSDWSISVGLPGKLPDGPYRIAWSALSGADGHETAGSVGFAIGGFAAPAGTTSTAIPVGSALSRALEYAGFSLAFGAAAFLLWMPRGTFTERTGLVALGAGATLHLAGVTLLAANTAAQTNLDLAGLATSQVGQVLLLQVLLGACAWLLAILWAMRPVRMGPAVVTLLLLGSGAASARLGHPFGDGPVPAALDFLHLLSAGAWVGGLAMFLWLVRRAERTGLPVDELRRDGVRFGTVALSAVFVLAATGIILAVTLLGAGHAVDVPWLLGSPYGGFLLGKVAIALVMVGLAGVNRYVILEEPADAGFPKHVQRLALLATRGRLRAGLRARHLRRTVAVEATLGAIVLVLAGLLTSVSPPAAAAQGAAMTADGQGAYYLVRATADPAPHVGAAGQLTLTITPTDPKDAPVANDTCGRSAPASCVGLALSYSGGAPEHYNAQPTGSGTWQVTGITWSQAGAVEANVTISTADHFSDTVALRWTVS